MQERERMADGTPCRGLTSTGYGVGFVPPRSRRRGPSRPPEAPRPLR